MDLSFPHVVRVAVGLLLAAAVPAGVSAWLHPRAPAWTEPTRFAPELISWSEAKALAGALWLDARSAQDFARGHVAGAISLPVSEWDERIEAVLTKWSPGQAVIVYCGGNDCLASEAVARRLREELGFTDVRVLAGGWRAEGKDMQ
jgi:rhodanese-related sulfurtransferase